MNAKKIAKSILTKEIFIKRVESIIEEHYYNVFPDSEIERLYEKNIRLFCIFYKEFLKRGLLEHDKEVIRQYYDFITTYNDALMETIDKRTLIREYLSE